MRLETKIATLLMLAALALSSCTKKTITPAPEPDPQPAEVGFTAASQAVWVKSADAEEFPYDDFGVWGIARQGSLIYNLWGNGALMDVNLNTTTGYYEPAEAAYWLKGYTYDFLAVAPFEDDGLTFNRVTAKEDQTTAASPSDYMTVTYDMSSSYSTGNYTFDLLGAAAQTHVDAGGYSTAQTLKFWHLLSQIEIKNIGFASGINGRIDKIILKSLPSGIYTISYDNSSNNSTKPTGISCEAITAKENGAPADKSEAIFANPDFSVSPPIVNIIPQAVANLELYIDFTITQDAVTDVYKDFKINLNAQELTEYVYNGKYNWSITIGTRNSITFDVSVTPWQDGTVPEEYPLS